MLVQVVVRGAGRGVDSWVEGAWRIFFWLAAGGNDKNARVGVHLLDGLSDGYAAVDSNHLGEDIKNRLCGG